MRRTAVALLEPPLQRAYLVLDLFQVVASLFLDLPVLRPHVLEPPDLLLAQGEPLLHLERHAQRVDVRALAPFLANVALAALLWVVSECEGRTCDDEG